MADREEEKPSIRFTFIEMLFALTIGEIATQAATLVAQRTPAGFSWQPIWEARCAIAHLLLALAVVATSWVGWSSSKATGNKEDSKEVFSLAFVVLLTDLFLVVFYFVLARSVEKPPQPGKEFVNDRSSEALWILVIFVGYAFWDVLTKWRRTPAERDGNVKLRFGTRAHRYIARGWASLACAALAAAVHTFIPTPTAAGEPASVVLKTDVALFALVLLFRSLKQASAAPDDKPNWPFININEARYANSRKKGTLWSAALFVGFSLFFVWSLF